MALSTRKPVALQVLIHYGTGQEKNSRGFYVKFRVLNKKFRTSVSKGQVWNEYFVTPLPKTNQLDMELWSVGSLFSRCSSNFLVNIVDINNGKGSDIDNSFTVTDGTIRVQIIALYDFASVIGVKKSVETAVVEREYEHRKLIVPMDRLSQMDVYLFPIMSGESRPPAFMGGNGMNHLRPLVSNADSFFQNLQVPNLGQFSVVESLLTNKRYLQSSVQ
ncbi:hypothetical protein IE077_003112, partial [Cardiosporidium cionae]